MSRSTNKIPRDVQDGIRDVMDKRVKVSLKLLVKMETKGDKTENKVLALSPCRVFVLNAKVPSKLEHSFHFLDIQSIESKKPHQLSLTIDGKTHTFQALETDTEEMDHVITHIGISLKQIFPSFPLERLIAKVDVHPAERLKVMNDLISSMEGKTHGPCGGYTTMYQCMCDYHAMPLREEVEWDVDTIYLSLDSREFRLQDFDHLLPRDLVPIIGALEHNAWFKALDASNVKLSVDACGELIRMMKRNAVIEEVNLSNTGIKSDFVQKFALALISNSGTQLNTLNISNNLLEDRGINHLLGALKHLPCGLSSFDMSRTGVSTKCLNKVGEVLSQSPNIMASLSILKLNDNGIKGEDFPLLYNCLAQPNALTYLDLSSTDCALDTLCDPLLRGCASLKTLRASGTTFTHKRSKEVQVPLSWKQLFSSSCCLEHVDLSNCRLPSEALKELFLGVTANRNLKGVYLDVSSNELGPSGAMVIAPCLPDLSGVRGMDLSNNGFDVELKTLLPELAKNHKIKHLSLGRNFGSIKQKFRADVMNALTLLLQEENSGLESLSFADSKLKEETAYIINALGSNETLLEIDISGNLIGDLGARMLAKALMINNKLRQVVWDKNNVSAQGFEDVAEALKKNLALKKMPYPVNDAATALRMYPERTESALQKIEACLQRNHSPRRFAPDQAYRLQQGFLISSTQQMVDRLVVKVEDTVSALRQTSSAEAHAQEVESALKLVADANNSRQLLPSLQEIALKSQAAGNPVDTQLQDMADSLRKAIEQQMEKTTEEMLNCTSNHCPAVMADNTFHKTMLEGCQSKSALPKDFIKGVLETASTDIYNTTSEMNLAVAALISDNVTDGVIDSLSTSHKSLITHLSIRKSGLFTEDEKEETVMERLSLPVETFLMPSMDFSIYANSPKLANKRKSVLNRKTRPQSTMGEEAVQNIPRAPAAADNHVISKVKQNSAASCRSGSSDQLVEVPDLPTLTTTSKPLSHVTASRPRRAKAHRPTRPVIATGTTEMEDGMDNIPEIPIPVPTTSSSPKAPERKDHKSKKEESPSRSKPKQEESSSGKAENKRWMPSFMKKDKPKKDAKEEDKLKKEAKEPKKSSSFSLFRKRGSEDRKRPSLANEESPGSSQIEARPEPDMSNSSNSHRGDSKRPVNTPIDVIKESPEAVPAVTITVDSAANEDDAAATTNKSPGPVAPRRMLPHDRSAVLPPKAKSSGGDKSTERQRAAESSAKPGDDEAIGREDQKEGAAGEAKDSPSHSQPGKSTDGEESEVEKRKLPPGLAKMPGLGALGGKNLLQEIEQKQKKRFSQKLVSPGEEQKELATPVLKAAAETNNNVHDQMPSSPTPVLTEIPASTSTPAAAPEVTSKPFDASRDKFEAAPAPSEAAPTPPAAATTPPAAAPTPHAAAPTSPAAAPTPPAAATTPPAAAPSPAAAPTPPAAATTPPAAAPTPPAAAPKRPAAAPTRPAAAPTRPAASPTRPAASPTRPAAAPTPPDAASTTPSSPATSTAVTTPTKVAPERPSRPSRPPSAATGAAAATADNSKGDGNAPSSEASPPPSKCPPRPMKPPLPSPAPRTSAAFKRPVSVAETPGATTGDIPSSMTTSTPEFHVDNSSSDSSAQHRPTPPPKRPPIMPRPKKRDSAPPTEESSDIQPQLPSTATAATTTSQEDESKLSTHQAAAAPTLSPTTTTLISDRKDPASVTPKSATDTGNQIVDISPHPPVTPSELIKEIQQKQEQDKSPGQEKSNVISKPVTSLSEEAKATELNPPEEGIVYDSATLRMSVKDKIKRLAKTEALGGLDAPKGFTKPPHEAAKIKAMSLPKDARLPDSSHDSESDVSNKSTNQMVTGAIPEEEVASLEGKEKADRDSPDAATPSKPSDEIMV